MISQNTMEGRRIGLANQITSYPNAAPTVTSSDWCGAHSNQLSTVSGTVVRRGSLGKTNSKMIYNGLINFNSKPPGFLCKALTALVY